MLAKKPCYTGAPRYRWVYLLEVQNRGKRALHARNTHVQDFGSDFMAHGAISLYSLA